MLKRERCSCIIHPAVMRMASWQVKEERADEKMVSTERWKPWSFSFWSFFGQLKLHEAWTGGCLGQWTVKHFCGFNVLRCNWLLCFSQLERCNIFYGSGIEWSKLTRLLFILSPALLFKMNWDPVTEYKSEYKSKHEMDLTGWSSPLLLFCQNNWCICKLNYTCNRESLAWSMSARGERGEEEGAAQTSIQIKSTGVAQSELSRSATDWLVNAQTGQKGWGWVRLPGQLRLIQ